MSYAEDVVRWLKLEIDRSFLLAGKQLIPYMTLPKKPSLNFVCDCHKKAMQVELCNGVYPSTTDYFVRLKAEVIGFQIGQTEKTFLVFIGKCEKCNQEYIAAEVETLKCLAYAAALGEWPL